MLDAGAAELFDTPVGDPVHIPDEKRMLVARLEGVLADLRKLRHPDRIPGADVLQRRRRCDLDARLCLAGLALVGHGTDTDQFNVDLVAVLRPERSAGAAEASLGIIPADAAGVGIRRN